MTDPRHEDALHRYLDSELDDDERAEIEAMLDNDRDRADLHDFERLGDLLRAHAEDVASELPSEALYERIRAHVDEDQRLGRGYMRVVPGGGRSRAIRGLGLGLAVAAAAALGIFARGQGHTDPIADHVAPDAGAAVAVLEEPTLGSEVVEVDFGGNAGTVFAVEGSAGQPLAVVWIEDEKPSL